MATELATRDTPRSHAAWHARLAPHRGWILAAAGILPLLVFGLHGPIAQDPAYHRFADERSLLGIPHGWNVLSNAALLLVGIAGLGVVRRLRRAQPQALWWPYAMIYFGMLLTSAGSAWYHLAPDNASLVWDRLPMTIVFMSLFSSVIAELVSRRLAQALLPGLLAAGIGSVLYWHYTELQGVGDLRLYAVVQFLPMLLTPLLFVLYPRSPGYLPWIVAMLATYLASKLFEFYDGPLFAMGGVLSGHTLKHLLAALSPAWLLPMLWRRAEQQAATTKK